MNEYIIKGELTTSVIVQFSVNVYMLKIGKGKAFPLQARLWPRGWVEV